MQMFIELVLSISFIGIIAYIGYTIFASDNNTGYLHVAYSAFAIAISYFIYLTPRLLSFFMKAERLKSILGYTLMFKEIVITVFLLYLLYLLNNRYSFNRKTLNYSMYVLAGIRIIVLLLPYNNWTTVRSTSLTILSFIPFLFSGLLLVLLYRQKSARAGDMALSFFWIVLALYVFSATVEMFFYSKSYIVYPNLITIFAMYWLLFKDFTLQTFKRRQTD